MRQVATILLLSLLAAWLATPAEAFPQRLYRRAELGTYDANTVLLLHFDGTDGATTTTDSSHSAHAVTLAGDAQLDTAQKQYGTASLLLDGSGDYTSTAESSDWDFGTGDFTIEGWMRKSTDTDALMWSAAGATSGYLEINWNTNATNEFRWYLPNGGPTLIVACPSLNAWHHFACVRTGNTVLLFIDGVQGDSDTFTGSADTQGAFVFGAKSTIQYYYAGHLDEIRISKGVARYTANFTPSGPFDP